MQGNISTLAHVHERDAGVNSFTLRLILHYHSFPAIILGFYQIARPSAYSF
jgi:hypothetical protein